MMSRIKFTASLLIVCQLVSWNTATAQTIETVATGFRSPWAMEFLPNGDVLVTERAGVIRLLRDGKLTDVEITGVPDVHYQGQGGLLDLVADADFATNQTLYLSYAHGSKKANATRLASARLIGNELQDFKVLFTASPLKDTGHHFAGRIAQMPDGTLLLAVGDGFDYREQAQQLDNHLGKIIRIDKQGAAPSNNPFVNTKGAKPEIWSYGHRNHQSLLAVGNTVYQNEHGPQGGDEVNIIRPGLNYGWPIITRGIDYNGAQITPFTEYKGMQQPLVDWTPSIAPSSMAYLDGKLYVTSLAEKSIRQLDIKGESITDMGIVFKQLNERMRDISVGPDGHLYVLSDGDNAKLIRIELN